MLHRRLTRWLVVTAIGASWCLAPAALAQETGPSAGAPVDGSAAAVRELQVAADQLSEEKISGIAEADAAALARVVVNVLEGEQGEHYSADAANPGDGHGAITYLEELTGRSRSEFTVDALPALAGSTADPPAVRAFAHVLLADSLLTGGSVTGETLAEAADHIREAITLLSGVEAGAQAGAEASGQ